MGGVVGLVVGCWWWCGCGVGELGSFIKGRDAESFMFGGMFFRGARSDTDPTSKGKGRAEGDSRSTAFDETKQNNFLYILYKATTTIYISKKPTIEQFSTESSISAQHHPATTTTLAMHPPIPQRQQLQQ